MIEIDRRYLIAVVVALAVACYFFPLFGAGVGVGVVVGVVVALYFKPVYDRWVLERKKRVLVRKREEVRRLEDEVRKGGCA